MKSDMKRIIEVANDLLNFDIALNKIGFIIIDHTIFESGRGYKIQMD